jgi:5-methylcytosine-specific restriction protein A
MALKTLKPRLNILPPTLKTSREIRDKRYSADAAVRSWYHSARWQKLREAVLIRDLYTCQHTGVILTTGRTEPNAAVVHHKIPHHGDEMLFWSIENLELVSKAWHDSEAQRAERKSSGY